MNIVICSPGNSFSKNFRRSYTELLHYMWGKGIRVILSDASSCNVYYVRNICLGADVTRGIHQKPFNGKIPYTHLLWLDSDMVFTPKDFQTLLNKDVDIVSAVYNWEGGQGTTSGLWDIEFFKKNGYMPFFTEESIKKEPKTDKGLIEVDWVGLGFILIKRGVFESLEYPWFRPLWTTETVNGVIVSDFSMEDVAWSRLVTQNGYKIYVDPTVKVGHEKLQIF